MRSRDTPTARPPHWLLSTDCLSVDSLAPMYSVFLTTHSIVRWLVIIAGIVAAIRAWRASSSTVAASVSAEGLVFTVLFDIQLLLGLLLYLVFSPITTAAVHHLGGAMSNAVVRFWAVEHPFGMIVALALAHVGRARSRRAQTPPQQRRAATFFSLAILVVIVTTPWPFLPYGRPLI